MPLDFPAFRVPAELRFLPRQILFSDRNHRIRPENHRIKFLSKSPLSEIHIP